MVWVYWRLEIGIYLGFGIWDLIFFLPWVYWNFKIGIYLGFDN